jgi:hypothetical protein
MAETITRVLASFTPSYSIICDFRGLEHVTSDVAEFLEGILETGATVLTPPRVQNMDEYSGEPSDKVLRQLDVQEETDYFLKNMERMINRKISVLHVRGDEVPLKYTDVPLEPFQDQDYLSPKEQRRIEKL